MGPAAWQTLFRVRVLQDGAVPLEVTVSLVLNKVVLEEEEDEEEVEEVLGPVMKEE